MQQISSYNISSKQSFFPIFGFTKIAVYQIEDERKMINRISGMHGIDE